VRSATITQPTTYAAGPQALYGIWDWDMGAWNTKAHMALASLAGPRSFTVGNLVPQSITQVNTTAVSGTSILGEEAVSTNPVCWFGTSVCSSGNTQVGWTLPLPNSGEQVIYNPSVWQGILQVNTTIPNPSTSVYSCSTSPPTGWTIFISPSSGGAFPTSPFVNGSGAPLTMVGVNGASAPVSGVSVNGTGSITNVSASGQYFWLTDTSNGTPAMGGERAVAAVSGHRVTWTELR